MKLSSGRILILEEVIGDPIGFFLGLISLVLSLAFLFAAFFLKDLVSYRIFFIFSLLGIVLVSIRRTVLYDPTFGKIILKIKVFFTLYKREYYIENFKSLRVEPKNAGHEPGSSERFNITEINDYLILNAKNGKDIVLYHTNYPARSSLVRNRESERFNLIVDRASQILKLPIDK